MGVVSVGRDLFGSVVGYSPDCISLEIFLERFRTIVPERNDVLFDFSEENIVLCHGRHDEDPGNRNSALVPGHVDKIIELAADGLDSVLITDFHYESPPSLFFLRGG